MGSACTKMRKLISERKFPVRGKREIVADKNTVHEGDAGRKGCGNRTRA